MNKINQVINDKESLHKRIDKRLTLKLKQQKAEGKKFITDEKIDELIDQCIEEELKKQLIITDVSQQRELLEALKGIIKCCDGNEPKHEQIYHIANDAVKACNCG